MNKTDVAHIHCHSIYSIKDAIASLKNYVDAVYTQNINSSKYNIVGFAITDHGSVSAIPTQYKACNEPDDKNRITKGIYGVEVYHCEDVKNNPDKKRYHMVLLAKNNIGLKNIYKITSHGGTNLQKGRSKDFPVTDLNYIKKHGEGIIATTACLGGMIPQMIMEGKHIEAENLALELNVVFDEFYLEIQPHDIVEQDLVNNFLVKLSERTGIPLVITSDSHYIKESDAQYHDILKDINYQRKFSQPNHLRTPEELEEYCINKNIPLSALYNTGKIANMCEANPKPKDNRELLPRFPVPIGYNEETYLRKISFEGLQSRLVRNKINDPSFYIKSMLYELDIICNAGYAGYFLILWDWFKWCRDNDVLTGPGRGSAAGSIISYVLNITKVDPIKNGFIFERFLNPGRLSFPDIDSDLPRGKRAFAISYLEQKYGTNQVAQIVTFTEYKLKNTIKAILSQLGCDFNEANEVTKNIPDMIDGKTVNLDLIEGVFNDPDNEKYASFTNQEKARLLKVHDMLQKLFQKYPKVYDGLKHINGCIASTGVHAGGVIVCSQNISENMGIQSATGSAILPVIQIAMDDLEFFGFLN